jgi:hypothetical protein
MMSRIVAAQLPTTRACEVHHLRARCRDFPCQAISFTAKSCDSAGDHTGELPRIAILAKVDLLDSTHALGKRGLFEIGERIMPLFKKGDVVNIYQMSVSKGLLFEGRATVRKYNGSPNDPWDEHYIVRFHGKDDAPMLGEDYERFIDRDGQGNPDEYIRAFNERIGYKADAAA